MKPLLCVLGQHSDRVLPMTASESAVLDDGWPVRCRYQCRRCHRYDPPLEAQ